MDPWQSAFGNNPFGNATAVNATQVQTQAGMGMQDTNDINMLRYYAEQAAPHASRHPYDTQAAAQAVYFQQRLTQAAAAAQAQPATPSPLFVPPHLAGANVPRRQAQAM